MSLYNTIEGRLPGEKRLREVLAQHGNARFQSLQVGRTPVSAALIGLLNKVNGNALSNVMKTKGYDYVYHVFMLIRLNDGYFCRLEKNDIIQFSTPSVMPAGTELKQAPTPNCNLSTFINNAANSMGRANFFSYNAFTNNCQIFVLSCLKANGVLTSELTSFLFQDLTNLSGTSSDTTASAVTGLAQTGRWLMGQGLQHSFGTSNVELERAMRGVKGFLGVFSMNYNLLPKQMLKTGDNLIVNMEPDSMPGSHWVCIFVDKKFVLYFDSFGMPPTPVLARWIQTHSSKPIQCQHNDVQELDSSFCGQYCCYFLKSLAEGIPLYSVMYRLTTYPSNHNEELVERSFRRDFKK